MILVKTHACVSLASETQQSPAGTTAEAWAVGALNFKANTGIIHRGLSLDYMHCRCCGWSLRPGGSTPEVIVPEGKCGGEK